jgi:hypothetical protein
VQLQLSPGPAHTAPTSTPGPGARGSLVINKQRVEFQYFRLGGNTNAWLLRYYAEHVWKLPPPQVLRAKSRGEYGGRVLRASRASATTLLRSNPGTRTEPRTPKPEPPEDRFLHPES